MPTRSIIILAGMLTVLFIGCSDKSDTAEQTKQPRPVSVLVLKKSSPTNSTPLAGSVSSWKTENMGFQVAGRVEKVMEPGVDILGRTRDETGKEITQGTVIASLENDRYQLKLASSRAQKETALARVEAKQSEIKNILPARIKSAEVAVTLAVNNFKRAKQLFEKKAISQSQFDQALAQLDTSKAELEKTSATVTVAQAELISLQAQVKEAIEEINQAQKDLDDTELISPFNGQIETVHEIAGGYVQAGEPVATIQMMDPIQVEVSVSEKVDSQVHYNDMVYVYLPDSKKPIEAMVYEKATVADAATRTFRVTLLVRNERIETGIPKQAAAQKHLRIRMLVHLFTEHARRKPPYYVNYKALHKDATGYYVWKIVNPPQSNTVAVAAKYHVKKVRVVPGEKRLPYLQVVTMRELTDIGELDPEKDLLAGPLQTAAGRQLTDAEIENVLHDDDFVYQVRARWRLRPGDIVRVNLEAEVPEPGFFVPMNTILENADKKYVFVVSSAKGKSHVKQLEVQVTAHVDTQLRIEAVGEKPLTSGMRIVATGALFLRDGEQVRVS